MTDGQHGIFLDGQPLAVVLDLFSLMVAGWAMDKRIKAKLLRNALQPALWHRHLPKEAGPLGSGPSVSLQGHQSHLVEHELFPSMGGKGNRYDNARTESFFHTLKMEMIHGGSPAARPHHAPSPL